MVFCGALKDDAYKCNFIFYKLRYRVLDRLQFVTAPSCPEPFYTAASFRASLWYLSGVAGGRERVGWCSSYPGSNLKKRLGTVLKGQGPSQHLDAVLTPSHACACDSTVFNTRAFFCAQQLHRSAGTPSAWVQLQVQSCVHAQFLAHLAIA